MAEVPVNAPTPRRKGRWLKVLIAIVVVFVVLVVAVYFTATSSAFFKGVILPRASKAMNAEITVSDASISPFKEVVLHNLKVRTTGDEPLVSAPEVRARYRLMDILHGNINVDEVALVSPAIVLVENPDGTSNLDPILKGQKEKPKETKPSQPAQPSKPVQVDIKQLAISDASVKRVKLYKNGNRDALELSHVNLTVNDIKNGQSGKVALKADLKVQNNPPSPGINGTLAAQANGNFTFALGPDLKPASIQGKARFDITQAAGGFADINTLGAELACEVTPSEIKDVSLHFQKGTADLGQLRVNGPFDMAKTEGRLMVQVLSIDKQVLNAVGAKNGLDFGTTSFNSTNEIQLAKAGTAINAKGSFDLSKFQVTRAQQTTPSLDLHAEYNVAVDRTAENALLNSLTMLGTQKGNPLLKAELTSPMTVSWGNVSNAVGDSALNLTVTHLNLADWKAFLGDTATGEENLKLTLLSQQAGKKLTFDLSSQTENLTAVSGSNQISQVNVTLQVRGTASELKQIDLTEYKLQLSRQNETVASVSGSGTYNLEAKNADLQLAAQLVLPRLLQAMPRPDVAVSSGTAELKAHVVQTTQRAGTTNEASTQNISGALTLSDLTGKFGSNDFRSFGATMDLDVGVTPEQAQIRKLAGKLTQGPNAGGSFDVSATYGLKTKAAEFNAKLTDFNQNGLRTFLEPMLAEKKLVSIAINGNASGQYLPNGDSAIKANLQMANLVVDDPAHKFPATPLEAKMQVDASIHNQIAQVRQFQVGLTPTQRGKNELQLTGQVDMSKTNATQGNLKLTAESLDVTSYYDLFNNGTKTATSDKPVANTRPASPAATPSQPAPQKEPDPKQLPFQNFTTDVNIGRFYLREVELTNFQTTTKLEPYKVTVKPFQAAINGAPVNATVQINTGLPGWSYDFNCSATAVPLAPLVNSFVPERRGQVGGTATLQAQASCTGTSGESLQKTLTGQFDLGTTNLNLAIPQLRSKLMKMIVNVIAVVPTLIKDPAAGLGSLAGSLFGSKDAGSGSWINELQQSPIDVIQAKGSMGSGKVDLQRAFVASAAFQAETHGTIKLQPVLTNSVLNLPLGVYVRRGLAEKINMVPAGTATNVAFVKLPDYVTITGTVGDPKEKINKAALLGTMLQQVGGIIPGVNKQTGNLIQGLGGLLGGRQPAATNSPTPVPPNSPSSAATNQPPAPQSPVNNLLDQLLKPKKK